VANKENPKEPKGSKLDANNRAEYMPDLAQKESWDASGRSTWVVAGRVLPERCDLNVRPPVSHAVCAGGTLRLKIDVTRSHILAACWSENGSANILEIADAVRTVLAFPVATSPIKIE
jgi:hypothetical protein